MESDAPRLGAALAFYSMLALSPLLVVTMALASPVYGEETVSIDIPAGVQEGMQLSVSGRGNAGERGGPPGDLQAP